MARTIWLILTYTLLGPLVGAGSFVLLAMLFDPMSQSPDLVRLSADGIDWASTALVVYLVGTAPGLFTAILQLAFGSALPARRARLFAAPCLGVMVSTIAFGLFLIVSGSGIGGDWLLFGLLVLAAAISAFASQWLIERFQPLPEPA